MTDIDLFVTGVSFLEIDDNILVFSDRCVEDFFFKDFAFISGD